MYGKMSLVKRQILQSSSDYAWFAQLRGSVPIMCKIMCAHNRIILLFLSQSMILHIIVVWILLFIIHMVLCTSLF